MMDVPHEALKVELNKPSSYFAGQIAVSHGQMTYPFFSDKQLVM